MPSSSKVLILFYQNPQPHLVLDQSQQKADKLPAFLNNQLRSRSSKNKNLHYEFNRSTICRCNATGKLLLLECIYFTKFKESIGPNLLIWIKCWLTHDVGHDLFNNQTCSLTEKRKSSSSTILILELVRVLPTITSAQYTFHASESSSCSNPAHAYISRYIYICMRCVYRCSQL